MKKISTMVVIGLFLSMFFAGGAIAIPVQFTGVYGEQINISGDWYNGIVTAGINKLKVNGVATDSFCIDLADAAVGGIHQYDIVPLAAAADPTFGPMGETAALDVSKLWALGYAGATLSTSAALSLQVAIWEVVADQAAGYDLGTGAFMANNAGAETLLSQLASFQGQEANLAGLTNRLYQDYVIIAPVPEPATMLLLGLGFVGIAGIRRIFKK